jgi:hypothetical protein
MAATVSERSLASPEESLAVAVTEGITLNFGRWLRFVGHEDGSPIELQAIDVPGGYAPKARFAHALTAADAVRLLEEAEQWNAPGLYTFVNDVDPAVATRDVAGRWHDAKKGASTTDRDIRSRAALFVDVDAKRVRGTSATDEEVARTVEIATLVHKKLTELAGFDSLGYGHSGNGRAVFVALDHIPETPELEATIKGVLTALACMFQAARVEIDPVVSDAKRLGPAWGTGKRKGAPGIVERPHRRTAFVCCEDVRRLTFAELRHMLRRLRFELTAEQRAEVDRTMGLKPPKLGSGGRARPSDSPFERANATSIEEVARWLGLDVGDGPKCPGCGAHGNSSVAFVSNGLKCSHASCARKGAPDCPGFRSPVDLVAEHHGVDARDAVQLLAERFGFEGFSGRADEAASEEQPPLAPSLIATLWRKLDPALLTSKPPPRRWLLRHPTRDGNPCARGDGDGLLPRGKVGLFSSEGGVGKTHAVLSMAVAIAAGRRWLGHFDVDAAAHPGKILLGLAEEDAEEVHRRLYQIAEALELDDADRARVAEQIIVLPLAGSPVPLITYGEDGRTLVASPHLMALRAKLTEDAGANGWSLVVLDPLARWAGPDVEANNESATRLVQVLETLTGLPGNPTVLVAHHSSKLARRDGGVDARGVTGIVDAMRWAATLRIKDGDVFFIQSKSNYSRPMFDELRLVRGPGGLLRAATAEEEQRRDDGVARTKCDEVKRQFEEDMALVYSILPVAPKTASRSDIEAALAKLGKRWGDKRLEVALAGLDRDGRAEDLSDGRRAAPRQWVRTVAKQ